MSSLRTLHTSLGSNKNNYQVISKGYSFSEDPKSSPQSDLLSVSAAVLTTRRRRALGVGTKGPYMRQRDFHISEPQFLQI